MHAIVQDIRCCCLMMQMRMQQVLLVFIIVLILFLVVCGQTNGRIRIDWMRDDSVITFDVGDVVESLSQRGNVGGGHMLEFVHVDDQFVAPGECFVANLNE